MIHDGYQIYNIRKWNHFMSRRFDLGGTHTSFNGRLARTFIEPVNRLSCKCLHDDERDSYTKKHKSTYNSMIFLLTICWGLKVIQNSEANCQIMSWTRDPYTSSHKSVNKFNIWLFYLGTMDCRKSKKKGMLVVYIKWTINMVQKHKYK